MERPEKLTVPGSRIDGLSAQDGKWHSFPHASKIWKFNGVIGHEGAIRMAASKILRIKPESPIRNAKTSWCRYLGLYGAAIRRVVNSQSISRQQVA